MSRTNLRPFVRRISRHDTVPPELREEAKSLLKKPGRPVKQVTPELLAEIVAIVMRGMAGILHKRRYEASNLEQSN